MPNDDGLFFLSDVHLRQLDAPGERAKQAHLRAFLRHLHGRARRLFIVGDLFDFWFEYRSVVPRRGGRVLAALADLVDAGVEVTCFGGNHDWWIGPSLTEEYGIAVRHDPLWVEAQGKRLFLAHGDGDSVPSRSYHLVRRVLHNRWAIRAFRAVHPDLGAAAARLVSGNSEMRDREDPPALQRAPVFEQIAGEVFSAGADIAVFGHVHAARVEVFSAGTLVVLGDWIWHGTYGEFAGGEFSLRTWRSPELPPWPQ